MSYANYDDVLDQIRGAGLLPDGDLKLSPNGKKSIRCKVEGYDQEKRGWYRLHEWQLDGHLMLVGSFGVYEGDNPNTRKIELSKRCPDCGREMALKVKACPGCGSTTAKARQISEEQKAALKARLAENKKRAEAELKADLARAAQWAAAVWRKCEPAAPGGHDYLVRKRLAGSGEARIFTSNEGVMLDGAQADDYKYLATFHGALVVPLMDDRGSPAGLQFILSRELHKECIARIETDKVYWPAGMSTTGHYHLIGAPRPGQPLLEAEGFATGLQLFETTGHAVAIAFDAGNLLPVAQKLSARYKKRVPILICGDDDAFQYCRACKKITAVSAPECTHCGAPHGKQNAGLLRAADAALAVSGAYLLPVFAADRAGSKKISDFNDLACIEGKAVVAAQVEKKLEELGWSVAGRGDSPPPPGGGSPTRGEGGNERREAVSLLPLDELVERFVHVDDDTGEYAFDHWTRQVVRFTKVVKMLPARVRTDDIKDHPTWKSRAVYIDQIGFDPGGEDRNILCNRWTGWPTAPVPGSCDVLLDLLRYLCGGEDNAEELFRWVVKWLAYPIQHPGAKMHSAIVVHGPQGTGKSRFFEAYAKIYGDYGMVLNQGAIEDKFNADWSERKLFILADEIVARADMYHLKNQLKGFITGEWVRVNPKNVAAHRERNHMNIVFTSNEKQPVVLENDDRRHCVIWTPPKLGDEFYAEVNGEIETGGIAALHHHLMHLELGDFKPWSRPPMTTAKRELIDINLDSTDRFLRDWQAGETPWPFCPCGSMDLFAAYRKYCTEHGVVRPRESNQFLGHITKLQGWSNMPRHRYESTFMTGKTRSFRMVIPDDAALRKDGRAFQEGGTQAEWLTICHFDFKNALDGTSGGGNAS